MGSVRADPNEGPIKLEHDITPRDMNHINMFGLSSSLGLNSYRYKGFPESNFTEGRHPLLGSPKAVPTVSYKRQQHFVIGKPNEISKNGVHYSSDDHSEKASQSILPRKKTPFWNEDRSSAEERKRAKQQREAHWDQSMFKKMQEEKKIATMNEKKKDLQMLKDYKPFGKVGGGAPRAEQETYRTKALEIHELNKGPQLMQYPVFGKPGHGAPIRTDSGKLVASIRANNDIRFRDGLGLRSGIENNTRYSNPKEFGDKVNNELGNMALEKRTQKEMERLLDREEEIRTWQYNPFGKSGGGAPIKTESGNLLTGRSRTLAKDPLELKQIEDKPYMKKISVPNKGEEKQYDPWGKGQGAPQYDSHGNTKRLRWNDPMTAMENCSSINGVALETKSYGGGGHLIDEKGEKKTRLVRTLQQSTNPGGKIIQDLDRPGQPKDENEPWGRPGAGAPVYLPDGKVHAANRGKAIQDLMGIQPPRHEEVIAKKQYLDSLKTEIETQRIQRKREIEEVMKQGEETINWIRSKEVGYPPKDPATGTHLPVHHKGTSDVTRQVMDIRRPGVDANDYRTDLVQQAEQRAYINNKLKQESREAVNSHFQKFDQNWGRPGHGAPYKPALTRRSLDVDKFHETQREAPKPVGAREQPWGRTRALEDRFRDPNLKPTALPQQNIWGPLPRAGVPTGGRYQVHAPWGGYSI